ncbi:AAA family ATPase [Kitasatospora nipponensis]|uniref:AAA family ATPase n=1 Tax=Kitasatospora nipponensis TaxID=258049 RepID=A0ABN1WNG7_9ACTN
MQRFILTGTPGAGKTTLLHHLAERGHRVVEEAATDLITAEQARGTAEPWAHPDFVDQVAALQRRRQEQEPEPGRLATAQVQFHDRSPVCTLALARYLDRPVSPFLAAELDRITRERIYRPQVFFVRNLGFCEPTAVRRISYPEALRFERLHEQAYQELGFTLVDVPAADLPTRLATVEAALEELTRSSPVSH